MAEETLTEALANLNDDNIQNPRSSARTQASEYWKTRRKSLHLLISVTMMLLKVASGY